MLVIPGRAGKDTCDGITRRELLRVGGSAVFGINSVKETPGSLVGIALKTLRTLSGTLSLGSQRSRWLGPPWR